MIYEQMPLANYTMNYPDPYPTISAAQQLPQQPQPQPKRGRPRKYGSKEERDKEYVKRRRIARQQSSTKPDTYQLFQQSNFYVNDQHQAVLNHVQSSRSVNQFGPLDQSIESSIHLEDGMFKQLLLLVILMDK